MPSSRSVFVVLDGVSDFATSGGGTASWTEPGWLQHASWYQDNPDVFWTVNVDLQNGDWAARAINAGAEGDGILYLTDLDAATNRSIQSVTMGMSAVVTLQSTFIGTLTGWEGRHEVNVGGARIRFLDLSGYESIVNIGAGSVMALLTEGISNISIGPGGYAGSIITGYGKQADVWLTGASAQHIEVSGPDSRVVLQGSSYVTSLRLDGGRLDLREGWIGTVQSFEGTSSIAVGANGEIGSIRTNNGATTIRNEGFIDSARLGEGDDTVISSGMIEDVNLGSGSNYMEATGQVGSIFAYGGDDTVIAGDQQIEQINLSDGNNLIITGEGWVGYIDTNHGDDRIIVGNGGAQQIHAERGHNTIITSGGYVNTIGTYDGNDVVRIGSGGAGAILTEQGDDTVTIEGWTGSVSTGGGNDDIFLCGNLGWNGPMQISAGWGADVIVLRPQLDADTSIAIDGGYGEERDRLDLSAFETGVTLSLGVDTHVWQNIGAGYLILSGVDNVTGGRGDDRLTGADIGSARDNIIDGGAGNDTLRGGQGDDALIGGPGYGYLYSIDGADTLPTGGDYQQSALLADITGDGVADLVQSGRLFLLPGGADGSFDPAREILHDAGYQQTVRLGDVNGDLAPDLLTQAATSWDSVAHVFLNDGAGSFTRVQSLPTYAQGAVVLEDVTGDGQADLIQADREGQRLEIRPGTAGPDAFSQTITVDTGGRYAHAIVADVDGTGTPEIVLFDLESGDMAIVSDPAGAAEVRPSVSLGPGIGRFEASAALALADFSGDGTPDLVLGRENSGIEIYANWAQGDLDQRQSLSIAGAGKIVQIEAADMDGDGWQDLVVLSGEPFDGISTISLLRGLENGRFATEQVLDSRFGGGLFVLGDATADGVPDVLRTAWGQGAAVLLRGVRVSISDNDSLMGEDGNDDLKGGFGNDTLIGGDGDDWSHYEAGDDYYDGGDGFDRADYRDAPGSVVINLATGLVADGGGGTDTLVNVERVTGSAFDDTLIGNSERLNSFSGEAGDDLIDGGEGWDYVWYGRASGGVHVDLAAGRASRAEGNDTLLSIEGLGGSNYSDTLLGSDADNWFEPDMEGDIGTPDPYLGGDDHVDGRGGFDTVAYWRAVSGISVNLGTGVAIDGLGNTDTLVNIEGVDGSDYDDTLTGSAGADSLVGRDGDDILNGAGGADTLVGGRGSDSYLVDATGAAIHEIADEGHDQVFAAISHALADNVEDLILTGTAAINGTGNGGANVLSGNAAANRLFGGDSYDTLNGGGGADTLYGGLGDDTYIIANTGVSVIELANQGIDTILSGLSHILAVNVENLTLTGGAAISGEGNTLANVITGNGAGNVLRGLDGHDTIDGLGGNDTMFGGAGNDVYIVDRIGDVVTEDAGAGTDVIRASISYALGLNIENLTLTGSGNINATGNALNNLLTGNQWNNRLDGGTGADTMLGGAGSDTYVVDSTGDRVFETTTTSSTVDAGGIDTVLSSLTFSLNGYAGVRFVERLTLSGSGNINATGNALNNLLTGNEGNNRLDGGTGADTMLGGAGSDTLIGGEGRDVLNGGLGADVFVFLSADETGNSLATCDVINGFETGIDRIDLGSIDADVTVGGNQAFTLIGTAGFSGVAGQLRYSNAMLLGDLNGDSVADFQISVAGIANLGASDLVL